MSLTIQTGQNNPILRKVSDTVKAVTKKTLKLIKDMQEAMEKEKGVGLAAPQVGENVRVILVLLDQKKQVPMINPEILSHSDKIVSAEEGCLSLPGEWGQVERFAEVTVRYLDTKGHTNTLKLTDFNARVVQHEIDHINGILFTDHVKPASVARAATGPVADFLTIPKERETERL